MFVRTCLVGLVLGLAANAASAQQRENLEHLLQRFLRSQGLATNSLHDRPQLNLSLKGVPNAQPARDAVRPAAGPAAPPMAAGVMVRIAPTASDAEVQTLTRSVQEATGYQLSYRNYVGLGIHAFRLARPRAASDAQALLASVRALGVGVAELDLLVVDRAETAVALPVLQDLADAAAPPNDAYFRLQHSLTKQPGGIDAVGAWGITHGSASTVVAVVDTGVLPHPEFADRLLPGYDAISDPVRANDGDGRDFNATDPGNWVTAAEAAALGCKQANSNWHGTAVTGIIAARGNNATGIAGVNWNTRILPVRVMGKCGGTTADVIQGMLWAAGFDWRDRTPFNPNPAQVINVSLGVRSPWGCDALFQLAVYEISKRNILIVAAAGNESEDTSDFLPAACDGVVAVSATAPNGFRASYSNVTLLGGQGVAAPGGDASLGDGNWLAATFNEGQQGPAGHAYGYVQGTSFAAPHVSGVAALALAVNPRLNIDQLRALLKVTSRDFPSSSVCATLWPACGTGIVNAADMVKAAALLVPYTVIYEFINRETTRWLLTGDSGAAPLLRSGAVGAWQETLDHFIAWREPQPGTSPVCRFYSPRFRSHYFTIDEQECASLKSHADWIYEGTAFHAQKPVAGACPANTVTMQRWSATFDGTLVFRWIANPDYGVELAARHWAYHGAAFCVVA